MSTLRKKKPVPAKRRAPAPRQDRKRDSDDIERAVYDGMQDLRVKKPGS